MNTHDFTMGFWLALGALAALIIAGLLMGLFKKVA